MIKVNNTTSQESISIEIDGVEKTYAAVYFSETKLADQVCIRDKESGFRILQAPVSDIEVNGVVFSTPAECVIALNKFIGAFNTSAGTVNTIMDFTYEVVNDNNVLTIITNDDDFTVQYPVVHGFIQLPEGTNLDNIKTPGVYQILGDSGYVVNVSKTEFNILQTRVGYADLAFNYFRNYTINTGVWGAWTNRIITSLSTNLTSSAAASSLTYQLDQKIQSLQSAVTGTLIRYNVTGLNVTINNGSVYNLIQHLVGLTPSLSVGVTDADFPRVNTGANALLRFPANAKLTSYMFDVRLTGSMTSSSDRTFTLQLRRSDNSLVKGDTFTKSGGTALISESNNIFSYTNGVNDPYTTGGLKLEINNNSSSNITLTGFEIIIDGTIKNY